MGYYDEMLDMFIFMHGADYDPDKFMILIPDETTHLYRQTFPKGYDYETEEDARGYFNLRFLEPSSGIHFYEGYLCQFYDKYMTPKFVPIPTFTRMRWTEFKLKNPQWLELRTSKPLAPQWEFIEGLEFRDWLGLPPEDKP